MGDLTVAEFAKLPATMSPALAIMLDEKLYERTKGIAGMMARAEGFMPPHLIGKPEACFAVVTRALTWKLDPFAVAQSTYQTPGGRIGYEGKLCQAIIEASGRLDGPVTYEHIGDWSKVQGKFEIRSNEGKKPYPVAKWGPKDADGLGVIVRAKVKGEDKPRTLRFDLVQAFPLNSTLWATDPKTQICYTAIRRFGSIAVPELMFGLPMDRDDLEPAHVGPDMAKDITPPRPTRADLVVPAQEVSEEDEAHADRLARQFAATGADPAEEEQEADVTEDPAVRRAAEEQADKIIGGLPGLDTVEMVDETITTLKPIIDKLPPDLIEKIKRHAATRKAEIAKGGRR